MMTRCVVKVCEKEEDTVSEMFAGECLQYYQIIDYLCLQKYDQRNKHFSMEVVTIKEEEEEEERLIGYDCMYRYGRDQVKLHYNVSTEMWSLVVDKHYVEEKQLNTLIEHINKYSRANINSTLDKRIQYLLKILDEYFFELNRVKDTKQIKEKLLKSSSVIGQQNRSMCGNIELIKISSAKASMPSTNFNDNKQHSEEDFAFPETDRFNNGHHSSTTGACPKFSELRLSPPIASGFSRQNSASSTQNSVRYASFIPPSTMPIPVRRRYVVESMLLSVQRKEKIFEKIVDALKGRESPSMHELGLKFLRVYNGKFNYTQGQTLAMSFQKKMWFLTIKKIKYVICSNSNIGPRSVLILYYKDHYTSVHV